MKYFLQFAVILFWLVVCFIAGYEVGRYDIDKRRRTELKTDPGVLTLSDDVKMTLNGSRMAGRITVKDNAELTLKNCDFYAYPVPEDVK